MDHLSRLPLECTQHILHYLSDPEFVDDNNKGASLHALLCTNKHLASVTLPYLYCNPFQYTTHTQTYDTDNNRYKATSPALARMLLIKVARLMNLGLPTVVCLAYRLTEKNQDQQTTMTAATAPVTTSIFSFDYLAHIRHLDVEWTIASYPDTPYIKITPDLNTYMRGEEYGKMCGVDRIMEAFLDDHGHDAIRKWSLWPILRREVTWAIARPILEQLRSLVIPVADIRRYLGVIDRLGNLEQVQFLLDEVFDYGKEYEDT
ncbi:MAG: hypothetical protein J3R72DRAFT_499964 [Linnemannia gamsii]|nr:MAG: hypothetical protein J3R72DRAFT_499964 [Linnemannia gamsii]